MKAVKGDFAFGIALAMPAMKAGDMSMLASTTRSISAKRLTGISRSIKAIARA